MRFLAAATYSWNMAAEDHVYEAIKALSESERLRLVERVIHDLAEARRAVSAEPASVIGMWEGEPDLADEVVEGILHGREQARLRAAPGDTQALDGDHG